MNRQDDTAARGFLPGALLLAAVLVGAVHALSLFGPVQQIERWIDDIALARFAPPAPEPHPAVAVVAIDQATVTRYPPYSPINRAMLAALLETIAAAGPKAIGIDVLLAEPSALPGDDALAEVIRRATAPMVFAAEFRDNTRQPLAPVFEEAGIAAAIANLPVDGGDGVLRRFQTGYADAATGTVQPTMTHALRTIVAPQAAGPPDPARRAIDWHGRPEDEGVEPRGGTTPIATYPAHVLLAAPAAAALLRDRVVFVGATFPASNDFVRTAFSGSGTATGGLAGVKAHAHVMAQLLDGRARALPPGWLHWSLIAAAVLLGAALSLPRPPAWLAIGVGAGVPVLWLVAVFLARRETGLVLPAMPPALGVAAGLGAFALWQARRMDQLQRAAIRALSQRVPKGVIAQMMSSPDLVRIQGEDRELTILFTDLASFTTFSTERSAAEVMALLQDYLEDVSDCVLAHDGTIDKFIGDAVMAFWNAPLDQPEHAVRAIECALELDRRCRAFAERHGLVTRIGVHSGRAMVGFLGNRERLEYTAIGDSVNTAARAEAINKTFGTTVCISGDAVEAAGRTPGELGLVRIGDVILKGRDRAATLYAGRPAAFDAAAARAYGVALDALEAGEHARAAEMLAGLPPDDLVEFQRARCDARGPAVIEMTTK